MSCCVLWGYTAQGSLPPEVGPPSPPTPLQSPANNNWVLATSDYGEPFVSAVRKGDVTAVQFHPEKSGEDGLALLRRFTDHVEGVR